MSKAAWLLGAAPAFDQAVLHWLATRGFAVTALTREPSPRFTFPWLTAWHRRYAYRSRLSGVSTLVLPYIAGDTLLLGGLPGLRTLGVALGSDVMRRPHEARHERWFRRTLRQVDALWAVSEGLAHELSHCGRAPDWVSAVGVDVEGLPPPPSTHPEQGRVFSPRRRAPVYRLDWIAAVAQARPELRLVQAEDWPLERMFDEYARAEVVVSVPLTDGAPASVMEALCMGAHVVASGGLDVRNWLTLFGGTYGEPSEPSHLEALIRAGRAAARNESIAERGRRALAAREAFSRDRLLRPLLAWLERPTPDGNRHASEPPGRLGSS